jgi:hypothetical protein
VFVCLFGWALVVLAAGPKLMGRPIGVLGGPWMAHGADGMAAGAGWPMEPAVASVAP